MIIGRFASNFWALDECVANLVSRSHGKATAHYLHQQQTSTNWGHRFQLLLKLLHPWLAGQSFSYGTAKEALRSETTLCKHFISYKTIRKDPVFSNRNLDQKKHLEWAGYVEFDSQWTMSWESCHSCHKLCKYVTLLSIIPKPTYYPSCSKSKENCRRQQPAEN